jgi:tight adherence protein C
MSEILPDALQILAALLTVGFVAALVLAGYRLYLEIYRRCFTQLGESNGLVPGAPGRQQGLSSALRAVVAFLALMNQRWVSQKRLDQIKAALRRAGKPLDLQAAEIVAFMELSAGAFFGIGIACAVWLDLNLLYALVFAAFGACYPLIWLRDKVQARHQAITRALPYDLDLLTLSVEAGLDFTAALGKVVEKGRKGPLADELSIALKELKLGKTREEALRGLAARVGLPTLSSFVHALVQADKMGTPLGKILRILSTQMRIDRTQRAEKLANEAPVKLLLPLIGFIFPTLFIMLFGPIAYQVFFGGNF